MSLEIMLHRFCKAETGNSKTDFRRHEYFLAVEQSLRDFQNSGVMVAFNHENLSIESSNVSGEVHVDYALFRVEKLDSTAVQLIFQIAKVGNMVIIKEGGSPSVILTNPSQWDELPPGWVKDESDAPSCSSAEELGSLLAEWYDIQSEYRKTIQIEFSERGAGSPAPILGTSQKAFHDFIYVQARPGETSIAHLRAVMVFYKKLRSNINSIHPRSGALGGTGGRLEVPSGEVFYALTVSGDKEGWLACLRMFASEEGRLIGQIEGKSSFLLEDGRRFPLSACHYSKAPE